MLTGGARQGRIRPQQRRRDQSRRRQYRPDHRLSARGDVVDITQILNVAAGTNVVSGGYLRVTTSGLVQVDLDGGGNGWVTLSTINGSGAVAVRYLSGGIATNVSVARVAEAQQMALSAANSNAMLIGAAATGLITAPAAANPPAIADKGAIAADSGPTIGEIGIAASLDGSSYLNFPIEGPGRRTRRR